MTELVPAVFVFFLGERGDGLMKLSGFFAKFDLLLMMVKRTNTIRAVKMRNVRNGMLIQASKKDPGAPAFATC